MTTWARTPLRIKLVATLLALVAGALALAGFAAATSLRSYLLARVDTQLRQAARGPLDLPRGDRPRDRGPGGQYYVRLTDAGGTELVVQGPDNVATPALPPVSAAEARGRRGEPFTVHVDGDDWRVVAVPRFDGGVATVARYLGEETATVNRLVSLELGIGATVLVLLGAIGYVVVRGSLRPLAAVETTAAAIAAGDLSRRVPEADARTEVGRLAAALNAMLHQVESAFRVREASERRMRRFLADASHELRTPLTSIRGFAELYRQGAAGPEDVPRLMRRIEDEGARMGLLVDDLLLLARLDEERPLARDPVDLVPLVADAVHDARAVDPARDVTLHVADGTYQVAGDEPRLRQVLANLLGNALKHTPAGTPVEVRLSLESERARVGVVDHGPGLPPEQADRVFERFYRADTARSRAEGGAGLGLAIVAALTEAHGGDAAVEPTPGGGATFVVRLPLAT